MIVCPKCNSDRVKKNGHDCKGKQNYVCKNCNRAFVEKLEQRSLSAEEMKSVSALLACGASIREIGRRLKRSATTISGFIKSSNEKSSPGNLSLKA